MSYFEFPHTRTYDSDLGWLIKHFGLMSNQVEALEIWRAQHEPEYEELAEKVEGLINNLVDVISPWDSSIAYHIFSIVEYQGTNYIAVQDVPVGAMITNTEYWQPANTVVEQINAIGVVTSETAKLPEKVYPRRKYYRPEDYGAVINDESVNNAPFIKQAILDANANGGIVLLSEGIYYTSSEIDIDEHLYGIHVIGTGDSIADERFGTIIHYTGSGFAFRFTNGLWTCVFEDFMILASAEGGSCFYTSCEADPDLRARSFRTSFNRMSFYFRRTGFVLKNSAYTWFDQCKIHGTSDTDSGRTGLLIGDASDNYNTEYVTLNNCQIVVGSINGNDPSYAIYEVEGVHISAYDLDITDSDYGWYIKTDGGTGFINSINLDIARMKYGVVVDINENSLQASVFQNTVYTAYDVTDVDCRMFLFKRTSGGSAYNARFKGLNNMIRVGAGEGEMTYYVEETGNALAPGNFEFTFNMPYAPRVSYTTRQSDPSLSTMASLGIITDDFNNYKSAGLAPYRLNGSSANSPGFNCMLLVFANPANSVQIAIPLAAGGINTIGWRAYTASTDTWSAWALVQKQ